LLPAIDLKGIGFDRGAHVLVKRALNLLKPGERLSVSGSDPALKMHLRAWCREQGHQLLEGTPDGRATIVRGDSDRQRWRRAERAGGIGPQGVLGQAQQSWGLAARGALVEAGGPDAGFELLDKAMVWSEFAPRMYAQAAAAQWDPETAIDWSQAELLPAEIESAAVQVLTYLIENEHAALAVPARFLGRIHPHYREAVQFLAVQVADEARHVEVFARRAGLRQKELGTSTVGGRASLTTLLAEPEFSVASFLLSVLGEGTFLNLLAFLEQYAPEPLFGEIMRMVRVDESRHVAFAMSHLEYQISEQPLMLTKLRASVERRYDALRSTAGLGQDVFDALIVLAARSWDPEAIAGGFAAVQQLHKEMAEGRERRLARLGFPPAEAAALSSLHTRNFM
jgi:TusA-related sulfurtransferase